MANRAELSRPWPSSIRGTPRAGIHASRSPRRRRHGRDPTTRQAAVRAAALGRDLDAEQIVARALLLEAEALDCLGRYDEATATLATARQIFERHGDRRGLAEALLTRQDSGMPRPRGDLGIGYAEAVEVFHDVGDRRGEALALVKLARNRIDAADPVTDTPARLRDIEDQIREALALAREIGSHRTEAEALNVLGVYSFVVERPLEEPLDWFEQALEAARKSGDRRLVAGYLLNLGNIFVGLEDLPAAVERFEASIAIAREIESRYVLGLALGALASLNVQMADMSLAEERSREALTVARDVKNLNLLDLSQARRVQVAALRDDWRTVETLCPELVEQVRRADRPASPWGWGCPAAWITLGQPERAEQALRDRLGDRGEPAVRFFLARSLLDQGKADQARHLVEPLVYATETPFPGEENLRVEITALVDSIAGGADRARRQLEAHITRNSELGYRLYALENRLVLGRILVQTGAVEEGESMLREVAETAHELGCDAVARRASRLLS